MSEWLSGSLIWWARRRRFAEEWKFHLEMAVSELQSFGLGYREARRHARRRLGARAKHRRAAMREIGADARGLLTLLPVARARRSAMLAPCAVGARPYAEPSSNPGPGEHARIPAAVSQHDGAAAPASDSRRRRANRPHQVHYVDVRAVRIGPAGRACRDP